mgnify:CR=1 FL=1
MRTLWKWSRFEPWLAALKTASEATRSFTPKSCTAASGASSR